MIVPSLLNRSNYSFLQSTLTIEEIVDYAAKNHFTHVVISDLGSAHSWPKFYCEAVSKNLIPVFGLQLTHEKSDLLVLSKDKLGFRELLKLSVGESLKNISFSNLILVHLGGHDYFPDQPKYFANVEGERGVYVRENKFLKEDDFEFYCALRAIDTNTSIEVQRELNEHVRGDYLVAEVDGVDENSTQIKNIYEILAQCTRYDILERSNTLGFFDKPDQKLKKMAHDAFEAIKWKNSDEKRLYKSRLDEELKVIVDRKFCEYFLVVQDAVKWARDNDVYVGPGRGSVCGSLLAYILGITEIDPMVYDLYFERFLNTTRSTIPDIDIDVANNRRDDLFRYLKVKYGEDHVSLIAVYRTFKIKNSIRELGKAYSIPSKILDAYLKNIRGSDEELNFDLGGLKSLSKEYPHVAVILKKIQNYPCNLSVHAAGVIISSEPLSEITPLIATAHSPLLSSQWAADELKEMGLIKFDFLALQYLQSLSNIEKRIEQKTGTPIVWKSVDLNDPRAYETINKGHNLFIFQFENIKIRRIIQRFRPSTLLDLALISSIHRPGASDQISILLARKTSNGDAVSKTPQHEGFREVSNSTIGPLMSILNDTYGLLIYQEQLMKIVSAATSCSFGEADTFRRGIGNSSERIDKARSWFFKKSKNSFSQKELELLWDLILKFAKYGFNKSHAVAYALISYRLIWLKTYYPEIFYSEFLSTNLNVDCFGELAELGFIIAPPTYGKSEYRLFKTVNKKFYFPISSITGLNLTSEQFSSIPFKETTAVEAVAELVNSKISTNTIKNLIRVGFFDELISGNESALFLETNLENIVDNSILKADGTRMYQFELRNVEVTSEDKDRYRKYQKELLGVDINRPHIPLKLFEKYKTLSRISSLSSQSTYSAKYIGFLSEGKIEETVREGSFFLMRVSDGFYTSPQMALFGKTMEEMEALSQLAAQRVPILLDIEKSEGYYRVVNVRKIDKKQ